MLSFMRMLRGTFHMMLLILNWLSHAIVVLPVRPSPRPAVWSVRFAPPKKKTLGIMFSPDLGARHLRHPLLPGRLEGLDGIAERFRGGVERIRVPGLSNRRNGSRRLVEPLDHRVVVLVQFVELCLLDADGGAEARVT